jgi:hypothetical protein
MLRAEPT